MIAFLSANRTIATLLAACYFLALVFFHNIATAVADWLKYKMGLPVYNLFLLSTGILIGLLTVIFLWKKIRSYPERKIFFFGFLLTLFLIFQAFFTMMVVNMEAIHYIQYALLAILLLPLTKRFEDAFILATVLGIGDEIFQYLFLNPDFKYFDFNDILLNMLGAGSGLLFIAVAGKFEIKRPRRWYHSSSFLFILFVILLGTLIAYGKPVSFFPAGADDSCHWFSLYREDLPDTFWTPLYENRHYHIFRPREGIAAIILLTAFFGLTDRRYFLTNLIRN